jgi:hypothetical protein
LRKRVYPAEGKCCAFGLVDRALQARLSLGVIPAIDEYALLDFSSLASAAHKVAYTDLPGCRSFFAGITYAIEYPGLRLDGYFQTLQLPGEKTWRASNYVPPSPGGQAQRGRDREGDPRMRFPPSRPPPSGRRRAGACAIKQALDPALGWEGPLRMISTNQVILYALYVPSWRLPYLLTRILSKGDASTFNGRTLKSPWRGAYLTW